ncbi:MAG: hypothetical protein ACLUVV_02285 [Christensenellales bacterium]
MYRIIYQAIEDIEKAMKGMLEPVFEEVVLGHAEVRETFKGICNQHRTGCMVQDGSFCNCEVRLLR